MRMVRATTDEVVRLGSLSPREREIARWIAEGFSDREITRMPGRHCSIKTVSTTKEHIREKLGMVRMNHVAICRLFIRHGIIQP